MTAAGVFRRVTANGLSLHSRGGKSTMRLEFCGRAGGRWILRTWKDGGSS